MYRYRKVFGSEMRLTTNSQHVSALALPKAQKGQTALLGSVADVMNDLIQRTASSWCWVNGAVRQRWYEGLRFVCCCCCCFFVFLNSAELGSTFLQLFKTPMFKTFVQPLNDWMGFTLLLQAAQPSIYNLHFFFFPNNTDKNNHRLKKKKKRKPK